MAKTPMVVPVQRLGLATPPAVRRARSSTGDFQSFDPVGSEDWTAIILAGQRPGTDPLAEAFGQLAKALVPVCGQPMLAWVIRALLGVPSIKSIVVLAQAPDQLLVGELAWAADEPKVRTAVSSQGISESLLRIAGGERAPWPVLVTTADHPLLTAAMVETFLTSAGGAEVAVGAVERRTVLSKYPQSSRTWLKFSDGAFSGANLFALRGDKVGRALNLWARAEGDRKQALRLFWHFGPFLALRAATRTIAFDAALCRAGANLGLRARLVELDVAEAAIDVDKLSDHAAVEAILKMRQAIAST